MENVPIFKMETEDSKYLLFKEGEKFRMEVVHESGEINNLYVRNIIFLMEGTGIKALFQLMEGTGKTSNIKKISFENGEKLFRESCVNFPKWIIDIFRSIDPKIENICLDVSDISKWK